MLHVLQSSETISDSFQATSQLIWITIARFSGSDTLAFEAMAPNGDWIVVDDESFADNGQWVVDTNPGQVYRINPATGVTAEVWVSSAVEAV